MAELTLFDRLEATAPYQWARARMNQRLVDFFWRIVFADRRGLRVAEVACGSGLAAHLMAQHDQVALSVAADLNLDDYRQAAVPEFRAAFVLADIFRPAFRPASMDLVWNSSSIEEIERPQDAVSAMAWMVKPGGYVFVGVPHRNGLAGLLGLLLSPRYRTWLGRNYTRSELRELLNACGLEVEHEMSYMLGIFIGALARKRA